MLKEDMGQWDDVMDLEDFIKKHGDRGIKQAWKNHMNLHAMYEDSFDRLADLMKSAAVLKRFIQHCDE